MLVFLMASATTIGGFSYETTILSDRTKKVATAPQGYPATWTEHVDTIRSRALSDNEFNKFVKRESVRLQKGYYLIDEIPSERYDTYTGAGSLEVSSTVMSASPDIVSVEIDASYQEAGAPHGNISGRTNFTWSRRLHRVLRQDDVFARTPDRALRRIALRRFNNRESLIDPNDANVISLEWDRATVGRNGITYTFGPYELGSYLSGGAATLLWSDLKPYLKPILPFSAQFIRDRPDE